jgi:hypothetical protein
MQVRKLDTAGKRDVRQFVAFPFTLYEGCTQWVPPLISSAKQILDRRNHPFYRHSPADFFMVESEGQTLGRMAMLINRNYNAYRQTKAAFFGYFDVVDDIEVSRILFETGFAWARSYGMNQIIGPRGVLGADGSVLVEGFEHRAALGIPYNYAYYDGFIKDAGFEKDADYLSGHRPVRRRLAKRFYRIAERVKAQRGFWIKTFKSKRELRQWAPRIIEVHHEAFSQLHSYYPPTPAELDLVTDTLLTIAHPKLVKLVMKDESIAGFIFAYHDISGGLQKAEGHLWPFGWYYILQERRHTPWVNVNAVGLFPAHRGVGANAMLYAELEKALWDFEFEHLEMIQIDEANTKSMADMENIGVSWTKRHRHYRRTL